MEANEQNEDEMIVFVVGDDDNAKKYLPPEESDRSEPMPVPISVKIEPIEDPKGLYCNEDVNDIFSTAVQSTKKEFIECQPEIEILDEEYLLQEDYLEEEYITDEIDVKKLQTKVTQKKRNRRKTQHNYLEDVAEFPQVITSPMKKKRKYVKKTAPKNALLVSNDEDYFEIEFLEDDDIVSPKKEPMIVQSGSDLEDDYVFPKKEPMIVGSGSDLEDDNVSLKKHLIIAQSDLKQKGKRKKHVTKKTEPKIPVSDEEFLEIEYLDEPVEQKHALKMDEDDDYVPDDDEEEEEDEIIYDEDEYVQPKRKRISNTHKTTRKQRKSKAPEKPKSARHIRSFIAELREKKPIFEENEQKLLEYLAEFMRKRRFPTPLPNSYMLKEDNVYSCSYCDVESATEAAAARHYQQSHGPRYLVCLACGDDFRCTANLYRHEKRCRAPDASLQLQARRMFLGRKGPGRPFLTKNKFVPRPAPTTPGEWTKFLCPHCPAEYVKSSLLKEHMLEHTGFRPFQCSECPATFISQHQLNKHNKKHSDEQFICDHCGRVFNMKTSLASHMDTHLLRFTHEKPSPKKRTTRKQRKRKTLEKPKSVRHIRSFIAEVREKKPLLEENEQKLLEYLAEFMRKRRPPTPLPNSYMLKEEYNEYSCSYCDVESATEAAAARHYQQSHGPRYLVCLACGDDFRCTANLYRHEKRCRAPDASLQLQARGMFLGRKGRGRPFLTKNKFVPRPAQTTPAGERTKFFCPQCPAVYVRSSLLKEHMHKHTGFRPFQCSECPATYVSQHQLNKHNKKHSDEQFVCDHCGKVFNMKNSLASHMDTHLRKADPVPFICDLCGKLFKWKISLQAHMYTHEPRPRFGCGRCGRRYAQRSAVKVHIMRDHLHLPPPAACPVCPKRYNRMSHVKSHMKRDHGLILMTKSMIVRNLPYMKVEQLEGAKIVFNNETDKVVVESTEEIPLLYTQ